MENYSFPVPYLLSAIYGLGNSCTRNCIHIIVFNNANANLKITEKFGLEETFKDSEFLPYRKSTSS